MLKQQCPLFSKELEQHMVEVSNGLRPNTGNFCNYCFHPVDLSKNKTKKCNHCHKSVSKNSTVKKVPDEIFSMLRELRKIERTYVISFAFFGILLSLFSGFLIIFNTKILYSNEIFGTIILFIYLLITGRLLANIFGGVIGDQIGYKKGRKKLEFRWLNWMNNK